jgi:hypothetical protein
MATISKTQAIRHVFFRLGMQAAPKSIVQALAQQGIQVTEELVKLVRFEMLKRTTKANVGNVGSKTIVPRVRRLPSRKKSTKGSQQ